MRNKEKIKEALQKDIDFKDVSNKTKSFMTEFKNFATKGNLIDMAIGVVVGGAFGKITTSLVNDIIMPLVSLATGKIDFTNLFIVLSGENTYATLAEAQEAGALTLNYGNLITVILDFLLIALTIFIVMKKILVPRKKKNVAPEPVTTKECPFCKSTIHIDATRCPHCTSELEEK